MSRIVELREGLIKDPAYAYEFAKLEQELQQLKALAKSVDETAGAGRGTAPAGGSDRQANGGAAPKARSA